MTNYTKLCKIDLMLAHIRQYVTAVYWLLIVVGALNAVCIILLLTFGEYKMHPQMFKSQVMLMQDSSVPVGVSGTYAT